MGDIVRLTVAPAEAGLRLDVFLVRRLPGLGRQAARRACEAGAVRVQGRRASKGRALAEGERVEADLAESLGHAVADPETRLAILLELPSLLVIDKPAGLPSAALPGRRRATVASALLAHFPEVNGVGHGPREPGLVHRLDTWTSGALVVARSAPSFEHLTTELRGQRLEKRYLAVTRSGIPQVGVVASALVPDRSNPARVVARPEGVGDRTYTTHFRTLEERGGRALVEVRVHAAYRHQIRVHLASIGYPLLGDEKYGGEDVGLGERHALHASHVAGTALGGEPFAARVPLPTELERLFFGEGRAEPFGAVFDLRD